MKIAKKIKSGDKIIFMNYAEIKNNDIANGVGIRISLFVSGCPHHCKECFNEITWDYNYGKPFDNNVINQIVEMLSQPHIQGLTLLGGEPMDPRNQKDVLNLLRKIKNSENIKEKDIWCYTGYLFEDLSSNQGKAHTEYTNEILSYIDIIVDGPFILSKKSLSLEFRGSSNQRMIDVQKSLKENKTIETTFRTK